MTFGAASVPAMGFDPTLERGFAVVQTWQPSSIGIYGLGYIGLPTALEFVNAGHCVYGVDVRPEVVERLRRGEPHIQEPGLESRLSAAVHSGRFEVGLTPTEADVHLIAVPTPVTPEHRADLSYVEAASASIAQVIRRGDLVVVESTVPPGTCERLVAPIVEKLTALRHGLDYDLAHCPERVIPGSIFREIVENDRIVGGTTPEAAERAADLYRTFVKGDVLATDATTAELAKVMENTFRDVNIAVANEFAEICEKLGSDVQEAIALANRHPRVNILQPGIGVGGHCIPIDPWFLVEAAPEATPLIRTAREVNMARTERMAERICAHLWQTRSQRAVLLGLAYKPEVDDFRESPAVEIALRVRERWHGELWCADPFAVELPAPLALLDIELRPLFVALAESDTVIPLVAHSAVQNIAAERLKGKSIFDPAGIWWGRDLSAPLAAWAEA